MMIYMNPTNDNGDIRRNHAEWTLHGCGGYPRRRDAKSCVSTMPRVSLSRLIEFCIIIVMRGRWQGEKV